jgi:hypothetical protein
MQPGHHQYRAHGDEQDRSGSAEDIRIQAQRKPDCGNEQSRARKGQQHPGSKCNRRPAVLCSGRAEHHRQHGNHAGV